MLKLKPEYVGVKISQSHPTKNIIITFDSEINNQSEYPFFYENGFSHLFTTDKIKPKKYKGII